MNKFISSAVLAAILAIPSQSLAEVRPKAGSRDSRITYATFQEGQVFQIQTKVTNITTVELGQGEQILTISGGDTASFQFDKLEASNIMTIKPVIEGAATNVTVETNRRLYFLAATEGRGTPNWHVKFSTPGDSGRRSTRAPQPVAAAAEPARTMRYRVSRSTRGADFAPIGISDDGRRTFFHIPADAPMPTVFRADAKGLEYTVNTTASGTIITASGRSERWVLRFGDEYVCVTGE